MAEKGFRRKLTAILSADAVEYSRLMGDDEEATVRTLTSYREVLTTLIQQHNGKVLDSPGDNLLAEFVSVVDAVQCAVAVQKEINARNEGLSENRRMQFRIGINLGDVIQEEERIYGDGVNIAARLESLANPAIYALLGRNQDAQAAYNKSLKAWNIGRFPANLTTVMSSFFIEDRKVADRYADGLAKAGWSGQPTQYYKIYEENRLTGEEIRSLVSGQEITIDEFGRTYWIDHSEKGRIKDLSRLREGSWWIEDDILCYKLESNPAEKDLPRLKGLDNCGEIYRNPDSVPGSGKQYLYVKDYIIAALTTK